MKFLFAGGSGLLAAWLRIYEAELFATLEIDHSDLEAAFGRELERLAHPEVSKTPELLESVLRATASCLMRRGVPLAYLLTVSGLSVRAAVEVGHESLGPEAWRALLDLERERVAAYTRAYEGSNEVLPPARCTQPLTQVRRAPHEAERSWGMVGQSRGITRVRSAISTAARGPRNVLITGESGSGKELVARAIHDAAGGHRSRFVAVNCAALPRHLVESELFGHVRGAYTGANDEHPGLFRAAHGGTLFLDELTEMSVDVQAKLLRALEERLVRPIGGLQEVSVDVRVVASTNRDVSAAVAEGKLRPDLMYRLQSFSIHVPALRERREDIPLLAEHFLASFCQRRCGCIWAISKRAMDALMAADWPGNVRELRNAIEHAVTAGRNGSIQVADLPSYLANRDAIADERAHGPIEGDLPTLSESEDRLIQTALEQCGGNKFRAAKLLGISRHRLYSRLKRLGLF